MAMVLAGWLDVSLSASGQNLTGGNGEYWLELSNSQNNHIAREGMVTGARLKLEATSPIQGMYFFVARAVSDSQYLIVGKGQEITSGFVVGVKDYEFDTPIGPVLTNDLLGVAFYCNAGTYVWQALNASDALPIDDSGTARMRFFDTNSTSYAAVSVGSTLDFSIGGTNFGVLPVAALMEPPAVMVAGDSISEGSPLNRCYRNNATAKDPMGCYLHIAFRQLGWSWELGGNTQLSNNFQEVREHDLTAALWDKTPSRLYIHCGVNDIQDERSWSQVAADLDGILAACRNHNCQMILDAIFPWTNGTHAQNTIRDVWNQSLRSWSRGKSDVLFLDINAILGTERREAQNGDPAPVSGNRWDLVAEYTDDGTHLSAVGCAAAGSAIAEAIGHSVISACDIRAINGDQNAAASLARSAAIRGNPARQNKFDGTLTIRNLDDSADLMTVRFTDDGTQIARSIESA
ncbi:MAG: SGNH/GDSL hydrolase family protein [Sedimentisphaerales bacterium]|nr:SGNH/GDSL hydrolase family protein [Sedimentisphaerales bacterium]